MRPQALAIAALVVLVKSLGAQERPIVIQNVTVIDGTGAPPRRTQMVVVEAGRITSVGESSTTQAPPSATIIDGRGKFLIPGLWDMHTHLARVYSEKAFPLLIMNGVTTIREMGNTDPKVAIAYRERARTTRDPAPRVLIAGPTLDAQWMTASYPRGRWSVPTAEAGRRAVDSLVALGVDLIKVHSATPRAAYFAILQHAQERGLTVGGHVPDSVSPREAIEHGQRTIEHSWRIPTAMSADGDEVSRTMLRQMQIAVDTAGKNSAIWPVVAARETADSTARAHLDLQKAREFGSVAKNAVVWFDPTIVVRRAVDRRYEPAIGHPPEFRYAPPEAQHLDDAPPPKKSPGPTDIAAGRAAYAQLIASFRALVQSGARFVAGTDTPVHPLIPGFALQAELEQLVAIGLTPIQAIAAATGNAAEAAGKDKDVGTIAEGKVADLLLLSSDPTVDIRNTRSIEMIVLRGRLLNRASLDSVVRRAKANAAPSR